MWRLYLLGIGHTRLPGGPHELPEEPRGIFCLGREHQRSRSGTCEAIHLVFASVRLCQVAEGGCEPSSG